MKKIHFPINKISQSGVRFTIYHRSQTTVLDFPKSQCFSRFSCTCRLGFLPAKAGYFHNQTTTEEVVVILTGDLYAIC